MAAAIGPFTFADLSAPPEFEGPVIAVRQRPGVAGSQLQNLGQKGTPFDIDSDAKASSFVAAMNLYPAYLTLIGGPSVQMVYADQPVLGFRYHVLAVKPLAFLPVLNGLGPDGAYAAETHCRWTLLPVAFAG